MCVQQKKYAKSLKQSVAISKFVVYYNKQIEQNNGY